MQPEANSAEFNCKQIVQAQAGDSDRVLSSAGGVRLPMLEVAHTSNGPVWHQVQLLTFHVCVPSSRSKSLESGCFDFALGES